MSRIILQRTIERIQIQRNTGTYRIMVGGQGPRGATGPQREVLTANRTYYVRTNGSDSNTGLADTVGGAFLTIQKAIDTALALDFGGYTVTIQLADGTYTGGGIIGPGVGITGAAKFLIKGNTSTPGNVIVSTTSADCFWGISGGIFSVRDVELRTTTTGALLRAHDGSTIEFQNIRCGTCAGAQFHLNNHGRIVGTGNYSIVGGGTQHSRCSAGGVLRIPNLTCTVTGTPAFSQFVYADRNSLIDAFGSTFSGAATGTRYVALQGSGINTAGGGANFFPGDSVGSATSPGWYA